METRKPSISPLRQRMIDDMRMRKFGEKTQLDYVRAVRSPLRPGVESRGATQWRPQAGHRRQGWSSQDLVEREK
jgi:hypothetical protein